MSEKNRGGRRRKTLIESSIVFMTIIELLMMIITIGVNCWVLTEQSNVFLLALQNLSTIHIPIAAVWVWLFTNNQGIITRILSNKLLVFIGDISAYTFLIHYVITQYTMCALGYFGIELPMIVNYMVIIFEFIVTIALTLFYKRIEGRWIELFSLYRLKKHK